MRYLPWPISAIESPRPRFHKMRTASCARYTPLGSFVISKSFSSITDYEISQSVDYDVFKKLLSYMYFEPSQRECYC